MGSSGRLAGIKLQQPQEQRYSFLPLCVVSSCVQTTVRLPVFGDFLTWAQMVRRAITHREQLYGHRKRVYTESWLWERERKKIPCHTGDSNPRQYCGWLLSRTLYQVSHHRSVTTNVCRRDGSAKWERTLSKAKAKARSSVVTKWMGDHYVLGFMPAQRFLRGQSLGSSCEYT